MPRIFLAIQGAPGEGKTVAALTFPDPVIQSFDDNLPNMELLASLGVDVNKIRVIPWADAKAVDKYNKEVARFRDARTFINGKPGPPNAKDGWIHYLANGAQTLPKTSTLVLDSWTAMHAAFDRERSWVALSTDFNDKGKFDPRPFWGDKLKYSVQVMDMLKLLTCNVVVLYHEKKQYDEKTGALIDKIAPLQEGQFINQIPRFYPDYYRQVTKVKLDSTGKPVKSPDGKATVVDYWWQVKNDDQVNCRSRLRTNDTFVPAHYNSLIKFGLISSRADEPTAVVTV